MTTSSSTNKNEAPQTVQPQTTEDLDQERRCWECLRRRLVCDLKRPSCQKCKRAGVPCPGYGKQKPLTWITPGKVRSKIPTRKKQCRVIANERPSATCISDGSLAAKPTGSARQRSRNGSPIGLDQFSIVGSSFKTQDLITDAVKATDYYNTQIARPHIVKDMWGNAFVVPLEDVTSWPLSFVHTMLFMAIGHASFRRPNTERDSCALTCREWQPLHQHHYQAVKALNREIAEEKTRLSDNTFASIGLILSAELHFMPSGWQPHFRGSWAFITARGGFRHCVSNYPSMIEDLQCYLIIGHTANSTSPANEQLQCVPGLDDLDIIRQVYGKSVYASFTCPEPLFIELVRINDLRKRQASLHSSQDQKPGSISDHRQKTSDQQISNPKVKSLQQKLKEIEDDAVALLARVIDFNVTKWAVNEDADRGQAAAWTSLGNMYKSAMVLFAVRSIFGPRSETTRNDSKPAAGPDPAQREAACVNHAKALAKEIEKAVDKPGYIQMPVCWPAIALGVAAAAGPPLHRKIVSRCLVKIGLTHAIPSAFQANEVLERFWASGHTRWNDCFDRPYAFFG